MPLLPTTATDAAALAIRPEHIGIDPAKGPTIPGTVGDSVHAGSEFRVLVTLGPGAGLIIRHSASRGGLRPGTLVRIGHTMHAIPSASSWRP